MLRLAGAALATAGLTGTILLPSPQPFSGDTAAAAVIDSRTWSPTEVLEGLLFLQGAFGRELIKSGALGPLSTAQEAALEAAMTAPDARRIARNVSREVQARSPLLVRSLIDALDDRDPIAAQAAMGKISHDFLTTPTMKRVTAELPAEGAGTYVPGEDREGRAVLVVVVAGAVLVITVAAVGVGVLALVSTVAVGSTKVAGQNVVRKSSGATARAQSAELTATAIRVFNGL